MGALQERFRLSELAVREAEVERLVEAAGFERFAVLCRCLAPIQVRLRFRLDEAGRVQVQGRVCVRLVVECHRCLAPLEWALTVDFDFTVVGSDKEASRLGADRSVLLLDGDEAGLAQLVEDELILALPERPCTDLNCPKAPARAFPPAASSEAAKPLQGLAALLAAADDE